MKTSEGRQLVSTPAAILFAGGANFSIGNLVFKERNYPVQIVMGVLGFIAGTYISGKPIM